MICKENVERVFYKAFKPYSGNYMDITTVRKMFDDLMEKTNKFNELERLYMFMLFESVMRGGSAIYDLGMEYERERGLL